MRVVFACILIFLGGECPYSYSSEEDMEVWVEKKARKTLRWKGRWVADAAHERTHLIPAGSLRIGRRRRCR